MHLAGSADDFKEQHLQNESGSECAMLHSYTGSGKSQREFLSSGAGATYTCGWKKGWEGQQPVLDRVKAKFKAQGVRISITPGFLWEGDGSHGDGPSVDGDGSDGNE